MPPQSNNDSDDDAVDYHQQTVLVDQDSEVVSLPHGNYPQGMRNKETKNKNEAKPITRDARVGQINACGVPSARVTPYYNWDLGGSSFMTGPPAHGPNFRLLSAVPISTILRNPRRCNKREFLVLKGDTELPLHAGQLQQSR